MRVAKLFAYLALAIFFPLWLFYLSNIELDETSIKNKRDSNKELDSDLKKLVSISIANAEAIQGLLKDKNINIQVPPIEIHQNIDKPLVNTEDYRIYDLSNKFPYNNLEIVLNKGSSIIINNISEDIANIDIMKCLNIVQYKNDYLNSIKKIFPESPILISYDSLANKNYSNEVLIFQIQGTFIKSEEDNKKNNPGTKFSILLKLFLS